MSETNEPKALDETTCDSCGRDLQVKYIDPLSRTEVIGIAPTMEMCLHLGPMPEEQVQLVYPELLLNHHYRVCMVCSLQSMGVKLESIKSKQANRGLSSAAGRTPSH